MTSVSVVIPTYNRAHRLPRAIESVLRQGLEDIEIILVDDGSLDDTRIVAARYGRHVRYVHQSNKGAGAARNLAIRQATREFVAFLDSDDRWHDHRLAVELAAFRSRPDVGLVFSDFVIEKSDGTLMANGAATWSGGQLEFPEMKQVVLHRPFTADGAQWPADTVDCWFGPMYRQLLDELPILTSSVTVRRAVLDASTQFTEGARVFEDWEFFARVARRAPVGYVGTPTTTNVGHDDPGRLSKCSPLRRAETYLSLVERIWLADEEFAQEYPGAGRSAHGRALLAVAREAVLAGERERARSALAAWRRGRFTERRGWATAYGVCARVERGDALLRSLLRGRTLARIATAGGTRSHGTVNPAV